MNYPASGDPEARFGNTPVLRQYDAQAIVDLTDTSLSRIAERLSMDVCSLCFSKYLAIIVRVLESLYVGKEYNDVPNILSVAC